MESLVTAGCVGCGAGKLVFSTVVEGSLPLMGGEPVGPIPHIPFRQFE